MSDIAIRLDNVSKNYRLGSIGRGTLVADFNSWIAKIRGRDNPYSIVGNNTSLNPDKYSEEIWALNNISFDVKQGEVLGIIGKNGAGKSTLLKILSKVTLPTKGTIKIKGRIASLLEVGTGFHPELSGRENIYLNGAILGMTRGEITRKFDEIVDFSGVERFIDTPVKRYSSGMYVRLAFAVAAHLEPEILIIDEVLAVGDAEFQKKCLGKMKDVSENEGRTVLFVSHNVGVINSICHNSILLGKGEILAYGKTDMVISSYLNNGEMQLIKKINDEDRVQGNGYIKFLNCSIYSLHGNLKNEFSIGENFKIKIKFISKAEENIGFWLIIRDTQGTPILCSHQKDVEKIRIDCGIFEMTYNTKNITLLPGRYMVSAGVLNYEYTTFYEWIDNCQSFEVLQVFSNGMKYDHRLGYAQQDAYWTLEKTLK